MSFDVERFRAARAARGAVLGETVAWRDTTVSTNDDALAAARAGAPHGAVFGAEQQTRGRGRRGSEWLSEPGAGLLFSVLLRPELAPELAPGLALAAGLAVRDAVASRIQHGALVKWPNDVWVNDRKLSGVLVESQLQGARVSSVVVGIGINVSGGALPPPLDRTATSLRLLGAASLDRESLLAEVLHALAGYATALEAQGLSALSRSLAGADALKGRRVRVDGTLGMARGIDDEGRLVLERQDGSLEPRVTGHVELA